MKMFSDNQGKRIAGMARAGMIFYCRSWVSIPWE